MRPNPSPSPGEVPAAIQEVRRHVFDSAINTLTFHNIEKIFSTCRVARGGKVLPLARAEQPLDLHYTFDGKEHSAEEALVRTRTNALLVLKDGKIVVEKYFNQTSEATKFIIWSCTKSITSLLIGRAIADGAIESIDDPIMRYVPELKDSGFGITTIRDVLQMRSGADWDERYDFGEEPSPAALAYENSLVNHKTRYADAARPLKSAHKPGSTFNYSTVDTAVLGWVLERATQTSIADYTQAKLWGRLGVEDDGFYVTDGPEGIGREFNGAGFNAKLRDLGRLGQMVLNKGKVGDEQVIPAAWIADSTKPYSGDGKPSEELFDYGYQWWTVRGQASFSACGLQGQYIYIDPTTSTVIVRLGYATPEDGGHSEEVFELFKAISAWDLNS